MPLLCCCCIIYDRCSPKGISSARTCRHRSIHSRRLLNGVSSFFQSGPTEVYARVFTAPGTTAVHLSPSAFASCSQPRLFVTSCHSCPAEPLRSTEPLVSRTGTVVESRLATQYEPMQQDPSYVGCRIHVPMYNLPNYRDIRAHRRQIHAKRYFSLSRNFSSVTISAGVRLQSVKFLHCASCQLVLVFFSPATYLDPVRMVRYRYEGSFIWVKAASCRPMCMRQPNPSPLCAPVLLVSTCLAQFLQLLTRDRLLHCISRTEFPGRMLYDARGPRSLAPDLDRSRHSESSSRRCKSP